MEQEAIKHKKEHKRELTEEQRNQLKEYLGSFKRFQVPAKYYAASKILLENDEQLAQAEYDYVGHAYAYMLVDSKKTSTPVISEIKEEGDQ